MGLATHFYVRLKRSVARQSNSFSLHVIDQACGESDELVESASVLSTTCTQIPQSHDFQVLSATLVRRSSMQNILLIRYSPVFLDRQSVSILMEQIERLYNDHDQVVDSASAALRYIEVAKWLARFGRRPSRDKMTNTQQQEASDHRMKKEQRRRDIVVLNLPYDTSCSWKKNPDTVDSGPMNYDMNATPSRTFSNYVFRTLLERFPHRSQQHAVLLCALHILLHRYSRESEITTLIRISQRDTASVHTKHLLGCLELMHPITTLFEEQTTLRAALDVTVRALHHATSNSDLSCSLTDDGEELIGWPKVELIFSPALLTTEPQRSSQSDPLNPKRPAVTMTVD